MESSRTKLFLKDQIDSIFKIVELTIFLCFCIIAGIFMKDVIDQFQARETFMGQSLRPIFELPTIILCIGENGNQKWEYEEDVILQLAKSSGLSK